MLARRREDQIRGVWLIPSTGITKRSALGGATPGTGVATPAGLGSQKGGSPTLVKGLITPLPLPFISPHDCDSIKDIAVRFYKFILSADNINMELVKRGKE